MSCETKDGEVLSTFSGGWHKLWNWAEGPDCSDGPDKHCSSLKYIQEKAHDDVEIECIEDHGTRNKQRYSKYTVACKHNGVVLSTNTHNTHRLKDWAKGPKCQPIIDFSTTQSTTTSTTTPTTAECPDLKTIQDEIKNESAKLKCIENNGDSYKLGCYVYDELVSTKTGTVKQLKSGQSDQTAAKSHATVENSLKLLKKHDVLHLTNGNVKKRL